MSTKKIEQWLRSHGVYNAIASVDGRKYRINGIIGIKPATKDDEWIEEIEAPDWLVGQIRAQWGDRTP